MTDFGGTGRDVSDVSPKRLAGGLLCPFVKTLDRIAAHASGLRLAGGATLWLIAETTPY